MVPTPGEIERRKESENLEKRRIILTPWKKCKMGQKGVHVLAHSAGDQKVCTGGVDNVRERERKRCVVLLFSVSALPVCVCVPCQRVAAENLLKSQKQTTFVKSSSEANPVPRSRSGRKAGRQMLAGKHNITLRHEERIHNT